MKVFKVLKLYFFNLYRRMIHRKVDHHVSTDRVLIPYLFEMDWYTSGERYEDKDA